MITLMLQKFEHQADDVEQKAKLHTVYDCIIWKPDNWQWGDQELTNPWFRLLTLDLDNNTADSLIGSMPITVDSNQQELTIRQIRASYIDFGHKKFDTAFITWWNDDTRSVPIYVLNNFDVTKLIKTKSHISIKDAKNKIVKGQ